MAKHMTDDEIIRFYLNARIYQRPPKLEAVWVMPSGEEVPDSEALRRALKERRKVQAEVAAAGKAAAV